MDNKCDISYSFENPNTGEPLTHHWDFFTNLLSAAAGEVDKSFFYLGGGVNGGKTYCVLLSLFYIAERYPQCKIHIVRQSLPTLVSTTVESARKLFGRTGVWSADKSNYRFTLRNGSVMYFFSENFDSDKDLDRFKGLETNIFFLEQIEELQEKTFLKAMERVGRWKVRGLDMPNPLIVSTFNPTHVQWVRNRIYLPYKSNNVPENTYVQFITAKDNPFISKKEWEMYSNMDSLHYEQYVEGSWEIFENIKAFAYAFNGKKHISEVKQRNEDIYLSFDFNVSPSVCLMAHVGNTFIHIFKEIRLENSNVYEVCKIINQFRNGRRTLVTGDSSGNNRSHMIQGNLTTYKIILQELNLPDAAYQVPSKNMGHGDSRIVVNTVLEKYEVLIDKSCIGLIGDLVGCEVNESGKIDKSNAKLTHLLDAFRYLCHTYFTRQIINN